MTFEERRKINPFGLWPDRSSAISGLGGGGRVPDATYVFHSDYAPTRAGKITFSGRFHDLRATKGRLRIRVRSLPHGSDQARTVKTIVLNLAKLAAEGGQWNIAVDAKPGYHHAVMGRLVGGTDAGASDVIIDLDGWEDGSFQKDKMLRAKEGVFGRGSAVGRFWWRKTSPVDRAGLISTEAATIAAPASQMCTVNQMQEPAYQQWLAKLGMGIHWHRKQWEAVYILAVLEAQGMLRPGARGLGFGCGAECFPSYFAARGCTVLATDMPVAHQQVTGWLNTGQHSTAIDQLNWPTLCDEAVFRHNVSFLPVDMNEVPTDLNGFDFCWSACAFAASGLNRCGATLHP